MQVDLRIPSSKPVAEIVSFAQRCEDAGFSGLGFVDSHTFLRDVYVVMAQVLQNTERIRVRPAVTCPGPRHTSVIASVAKTVQELGPGRFELWLGRGARPASSSACPDSGWPRIRLASQRITRPTHPRTRFHANVRVGLKDSGEVSERRSTR